MTTITITVEDDGNSKTWSAGICSELVGIARAAKNPAVFQSVLSLLVDTAVAVCMNPSVVPNGEATPLEIT